MKMKTTIKHRLQAGLCLLLVLVMAMPPAVLAANTFTTSEEGIALIKDFEGYSSTAYEYNGKWYIGYGVECGRDEYPMGIDEIIADQLMRKAVAEKEEIVNKLIVSQNINLNQQQFDALVSLTYNIGNQWIKANAGYRLYDYLTAGISQHTELEVVSAFGTWCHDSISGRAVKGLVNRRLREAFLFLYGDYHNSGHLKYTYVDYNANGGSVSPSSIFFYPVGSAYGQLPVPTRSNYYFQGWFTSSGTQLKADQIAQSPVTATARWSNEPDYSSWVNPYRDVKESHWYYTYVREISAKDILGGYPDKTFRADNDLTMGEALKLIMLATGREDPGNAPDHWASGYLAMAVEVGCVSAGEVKVKDLDTPVDRLTAARMTAIAMGLGPRDGESPFTDVDDGYVRTVFEEGIFEGEAREGYRVFMPNDAISRAEISAVIVRLSRWKGATTKNDPAKSGYIVYGGKKIPVLPDVPKAPYDPYLFLREGSAMYYLDPAYTTAPGIDVSSHQGNIDWQKVAASGVQFAMIRLGYRGTSTGEIHVDSSFEKNLAGAKAAGLKVGVYFYSTAVTVAEAQEEARFVLENLKGASLQYPVAYDWESASGDRNHKLDQSTLTQCADAFCKTIAQGGYQTMIYGNQGFFYEEVDLSGLKDYDRWFAQYTSSNQPSFYYNFRIWQYSSTGSVPGIAGNVDMDIALIPYS